LNPQQLWRLSPTLDIGYGFLLYEAHSKFVLSLPPSISSLPLCNWILHTTVNSCTHQPFVRLRRRQSTELDRPRIHPRNLLLPLRNLLPPSYFSFVLALAADVLATIKTS
jgi:hypothetical protein